MNTILSRITDQTERALVQAVWHAGDALEAFNDGAIGGVTDIRREESRLSYNYSKAQTALRNYKNGR